MILVLLLSILNRFSSHRTGWVSYNVHFPVGDESSLSLDYWLFLTQLNLHRSLVLLFLTFSWRNTRR